MAMFFHPPCLNFLHAIPEQCFQVSAFKVLSAVICIKLMVQTERFKTDNSSGLV